MASSSLVPANDPTLLFTNAGMVQFKDVFLGREKRPYKRAVTAQRCLRVGGKHNDLENVGYTGRHHTFFEMLGNFSFGDYFKQDAIPFAWEFLTREMGLASDRLWVTVYEDDDEAADIWLNEIGVPSERFARMGAASNFWAMGDTGPCGPCSEVFYDHGPDVSGGPPGTPEEDGDRYVEIWNLVFTQFNRDEHGELHPLPRPSVDTGMGLERMAAVMQGVHSNYEIDLFRNLITAAARLARVKDTDNASLRVIADHIRASAFLIADGVMPSNEGRGYVLRRIIRRAARHGYELGLHEPFFYRLVGPLAKEMGEAYPELRASLSLIERVLKQEEDRFAVTLQSGMGQLQQLVSREDAVANFLSSRGAQIKGKHIFGTYDWHLQFVDISGDQFAGYIYEGVPAWPEINDRYQKFTDSPPLGTESGFLKIFVIVPEIDNADLNALRQRSQNLDLRLQFEELTDSILAPHQELRGCDAFVLYDRYGFPIDLTADYARSFGWTVDMAGYEQEMAAQRERGRAASSFKVGMKTDGVDIEDAEFTGYETLNDEATVEQIYVEGEPADTIDAGQEGVIYLDRTPFYAESGGQVGDQGWLHTEHALFVVKDTQKAHAHVGTMEHGEIKVGERVRAEVDAGGRRATIYNHSATHLLHAALKKVLGPHVTQKGSLVEPARLRFDFSHPEPLTPAQLDEIERMVNDEIRANVSARTRIMSLEQALEAGAVALFGEKYDEQQVRVVAMGDFSTELCGGTHVRRTGDIGLFKIVSEGGIAAGVRRIEALTGGGALDYVRDTEARLKRIAQQVKGSPDEAERKVEQLSMRVRDLEKELETVRRRLASGGGQALEEQAKEVDGVKLLAARLDGADARGLRAAVDRLKDKFGSGAVVLGAVQDDKVILVAGVTKDLTKRVHAGKLVNEVASRVGGKGGGRADMAQAGGKDPSQLDAALASVPQWLQQQLARS